MSFWSGLGRVLGAVGGVAAAPFTGGGSLAALPAILGAGGAALGAIGQGQANNRGEQFGGQMDLERLLMERDQQFQQQQIAREQEGRAGGQDAWRRLLAAQHTLSPGAHPQLAGQYSVAPRQATGAEMQGADAMTAEVMARLQGGNPIPQVTQRPVNVDLKLLKAGLGEKLAGYSGAGLSAWSRMLQQPQARPYSQSLNV